MTDPKTIKIEATIAAPLPKVWTHWTSPEHITKWNFAVEDWHCPRATNDLRAGGKYTARMEAKNGSFGFDFEGIYDEVVPQARLRYTMADGRTVATDFVKVGDQTRVTSVFVAESQNSEERQRGGWQSILDRFKKYVEASAARA